jgi:maltooligosyltrehalose trehalohydrolase
MANPHLHRRLGAIVSGQTTLFRIWAPHQSALSIELLSSPTDSPHDRSTHSMFPTEDGHFELELPQVLTGAQYQVVLADGTRRPDPVSRFQPAGVHAASEVVDPASYVWNDHPWPGIAKADLVIYELHLGTFTAAGTYRAAAERLPELKELGITAIELMPIAESAGDWNWGYDGVLFFAPRHTYGTPDDFRYLVDRAHQLGIAVILDVVYNHFGPEGNYFRDFGPYVSAKHSTAWGDAPNFDDVDSSSRQPVRDYFAANISYWIDEFHLDGLRVDAIHCMSDDSPVHIVSDLADTFDAIREQVSRTLHLIAESNVYDAQMLQQRAGGGHGYDAEWCDDFLHSVFAILRPGEQMSQRVYSGDDLQLTLQRGYVFAGSLKVLRQRIPLEEDSQRAHLGSLVYSIQNHDFIGNHPLGKRLHQLTSDDSHRAAAALLLLVPAIPMLFMGEEFAAPQPFYFFVDYGDEHLRQAVERGRRAEYPQHNWNGGASPISPAAFHDSKLGHVSTGNLQTLDWYQSLISLRKQWIKTGLLSAGTLQAQWLSQAQTALLHYQHPSETVFLAVRLSNPFMQHAPLELKLSGQLLINQNCDLIDEDQQLRLYENGVAIGRGSVSHEPTT